MMDHIIVLGLMRKHGFVAAANEFGRTYYDPNGGYQFVFDLSHLRSKWENFK